MQGKYSAEIIAPQMEPTIRRKAERQGSLDKIRLLAIITFALATILLFASGPSQDAAIWFALWQIGAMVIIAIAGRVGGMAWLRWVSEKSNYTRYLLHRGKRLAPIHILSISIVLFVNSLLVSLSLDDPIEWDAMAAHIIPVFPNSRTFEINPGWIPIQAILLGTLIVPVVTAIPNKIRNLSAILIWIASSILAFIIDNQWSDKALYLGLFLATAVSCKKAAKGPVSHAFNFMMFSALLIAAIPLSIGVDPVIGMISAGTASIFAVQVKTRSSKTSITAPSMSYPMLSIFWPVSLACMAIADAMMDSLLAGFVVAIALVMIASYYLGKIEIRVSEISARDAEQAYASSKHQMEMKDFSSHPS